MAGPTRTPDPPRGLAAWLQPPPVEEPGDAMRAQVAHWMLLSGILVLLALLVTAPLLEDDTSVINVTYGASLGALVLGYTLLHRGHVRLAGGVACAVAWVIVMAVSISVGGVRSPQLATMVLVVMLIGFLWSSRAAIAAAVVTSLTTLAAVYAGQAGLLPEAGAEATPLTLWSALTSVLVLAAVFLHLALHAMDESRRDAAEKTRQLEAEMERRAAAEESLLRAQKLEALGRLTGGIAHDFNNILTVLIAQSALLAEHGQEGPRLGADALAQVHDIQESAERAAVLTRRLLSFARPDVGRPEAVSPSAALVRLESMLRRVLPENILLRIAPPPDHARVRIDPGHLEQVLLNLVLNARDAMPEGGELRIDGDLRRLDQAWVGLHPGARPGDHVAIRVSDTGTGITAADQERIFDPFFTTKAMGHGTGLGLSAVHGLVTQAGGHLVVESEPGRGTALSLLLPNLEPAEAPAAREAAAPEPFAQPRGAGTILVCEDESPVRQILDSILSGAGYRVLTASQGERALALARDDAGPIDLLLTDVVMPGMSGPQLAVALRRERPGLPVLLVTGYPAEEVLPESIEDGSTGLLQKPFAPDALLERVAAMLGAEARPRATAP